MKPATAPVNWVNNDVRATASPLDPTENARQNRIYLEKLLTKEGI
jgi:hypothetical protein